MKTRVVRRLDLGELRPAIRREDGTMIVDAHLTRCGVFNYLQPDGTIRRELREPEQVFAPESLNSFLGRPVTNEHPPEMIDATNATRYAIGAVQGDVIRDDDHVRSRLTVYDHDTIQAMQNGKRQVSLGYVCDLDETGGVDPVYGRYDARQINIRGNHCAIVDAARAGGTARVRLDAAERIDGGPGSGPHPGGGRTHQEAQANHLKNLATAGWNVKTGLKIPHATSPDGKQRLWFKPQAIHHTEIGSAEKKFSERDETKTKHDFGQAHTLNIDPRAVSTDQVIQAAKARRTDAMPEKATDLPEPRDLQEAAADLPAGKTPAAEDKWTKAGYKAGGRVKKSTNDESTTDVDSDDDSDRRQGRRKLAGMGMRQDGGPGSGPHPGGGPTFVKNGAEILANFFKNRQTTAEQATSKAKASNTFADHAAAMKAHLLAAGSDSSERDPQAAAHRAQAGEHLKSAEKAAKPEDAKALASLRDNYKSESQQYGYRSASPTDSADSGKKVASDLAGSKKHAKIDSMAKTGGSTDTSRQKDVPSQEGKPGSAKTGGSDDTSRQKGIASQEGKPGAVKTGGSADTSAQKDAPHSLEGGPKMGTSDPDDAASKSASGESDAKPSQKMKDPASGPASEDVRDGKVKHAGDDPDSDDPDDDDDDDPDDDDDDDSDDDDAEDDDHDDDEDDAGGAAAGESVEDPDSGEMKDDAYDSSYNDDGELTPEAKHKMATSNFAVPDREGLPIHDPDHAKAAMSRFNQYDFKTPDEKHAAFNRISQRAKHFGISSAGFEKANKATLDRQDDRAMIKSEKLRKAREERDAATARVDALEGQIASLKKDLEKKTRTDSTEEVAAKVTAKVALVAQAMATGAKIDPTMSALDIKRAVVKHIDGDDVPSDKPELYVDALYDGALKRAEKDFAAVRGGAEALASVRTIALTQVEKTDADDTDEDAVAARMLARSASMHEQTWESPYERHSTRLDSKRAARLGNRDSEI